MLVILITIILLLIFLYRFCKKYPRTPKAKSFKHFNTANANYKKITSEDELAQYLAKKFYNLESCIRVICSFPIDSISVEEILSNEKVYIFNNKYSITIYEKNMIYMVEVLFEFSQGFKIFRSVINDNFMSILSNEDKQVLERIKNIYNIIIKPNMSDFEKELAVHDYLIKNSMYDKVNYDNDTIPDISYTPYGLLFKCVAVCQAYAEVFMIFMMLCNIECYFVIGKLTNEAIDKSNHFHAWNIVKINKNYYHIDVTHNNPGPLEYGKVKYTYFNVNDQYMHKTRKWNYAKYPTCSSMDANYYNNNKLVAAKKVYE